MNLFDMNCDHVIKISLQLWKSKSYSHFYYKNFHHMKQGLTEKFSYELGSVKITQIEVVNSKSIFQNDGYSLQKRSSVR